MIQRVGVVLAWLLAVGLSGCGSDGFGVACGSNSDCKNSKFQCLHMANSCVLDNQDLSICTLSCSTDADCKGEGSDLVCNCGGICNFPPKK